MRIGVTLPTFGPDGQALTRSGFEAAIANIDDAGFDSVWSFDTIGRGYLHLDPFSALAAAALVSPTLALGTCVLQLPLRNPVEVAQRALSLSLLSDGRFTLGVGAGSDRRDFDAVGAVFEDRFRRLDESLRTLQRTLHPAGEDVDVLFDVATPRPPVLVGSWGSERWLQRSVADADGWIGSAAKTPYSTLRASAEVFRALGGQRAVAANLDVDLDADEGVDDGHPLHLRCPPREANRRVALLADAGFDELVVFTFDHDADALARVREALNP